MISLTPQPGDPKSYEGLNVLVTGADGFIGSHLADRLVREGAHVTALSLYNSFDTHGWLDDLLPTVLSRMTMVRGDVRDASMMRQLAQGQDIIFHLAALIAIPFSYVAAQSYVETNILGTLNVLEAARSAGVRRVVQTSTSEVYGSAITMPISERHPLQGQSPYSATKIGADMMAEAYVRSFGMPIAILRPFNTFGPRQSERAVIPTVVRQLLDPACRAVRVGDVSTLRDFTFVADTAAAFLAIGTAEGIVFGQPYNAGSGSAVSVRDLIDLAIEITGSGKLVKCDLERMRPDRSEVRALLADSTLLTDATSWRPQTSLRAGLTATIAWWQERLQGGRIRRGLEYMT